MRKAELERILATPGMYVVVGSGTAWVLEIADQGVAYQCKAKAPFPRDGVLERDGWNMESRSIFVGPFSRQN